MPNYQCANVYDLFLCAVREMESASIYRKKKQYQRFIDALQTSAYCFARALLIAKGGTARDIEVSDKLVKSEINELLNQDESVYRSIHNVISMDIENSDTDQWDYNIDDIFNQYIAALVIGRKMIIDDLNYHDNLWNRIKTLLYSPVVKLSSYILLLLIFLFTVSYAYYTHKAPTHSSKLVGQVFWKADRSNEFNMQRTQSFPVRESTQFREYVVTLPDSERIYSLRFDPVHDKYLAEIDIEWIRFFSQDGSVVRDIASKEFEQWVCTNCVILPEDEMELFSVQVTDKDPFLTSPLIDQENVKYLRIRMRILSKVTFWQWVLGIGN